MYSKNPLYNIFRYSWEYAAGIKTAYIFVVVFSLIGNIIWLLQPVVIGRIFNEIQFATEKSNPILFIAYNVGLLIVLSIMGWIFNFISRTIENRNAFLIRKNYRQTMFERTMELPARWHKDHHSGDTIDKINKASENLFTFSSELFFIIQNFTAFVVSIIIMGLYDINPVFIALFTAAVAVYVILKFDKALIRHYKIIFKGENNIAAGIYDYISNYITIISLRLKKSAAKEIEKRSMEPYRVFLRSSILNESKWFTSSMIIEVMTAAVILLNVYVSYKNQGVIVIGTLFVLYQYLNNIGNAFDTFAWKYSETVRQNEAVMAAETINEEYDKLRLGRRYSLPRKWKTIQIKQLNFSYRQEIDSDLKVYAVTDASLSFERNMKIALIGTSGSGKSTVLSLLRGLHEPDDAKVFCDGKKLKHGLKHIHNYCTLIPQEPEIFNNTIEYNITMGVHVSEDEIEKAVKMSRLDKLISRLEKGLKTNVMERGVSLSGGEKQRLALARGFLAAKDSQFLLLDEPTSSVDIENEAEIYRNIFENFKDKVVISAVHGLHLLKEFDYIYLFKNSRIVAEGTFNDLLSDENFRVLWKNYSRENKK